MRKIISSIDNNPIICTLISIIITFFLIYFTYWVAKHGSYWLWYEDMVKQTITEMVKPEALK